MKSSIKYLVAAAILTVIVYCGYLVFIDKIPSEIFKKRYSRKDAIENYNNRETEITDLVNYFSSLVPDSETNKGVSFNLGKTNNSFGIGIYLLDGSVLENDPNVGGSDIKLNSDKADTLLKILHWSNESVKKLKQKLERANCNNISTDGENAFALEFRYSGYGLHSYLIFNKPLPDSLIMWYNSKGDTVIRKNVVVRYSSSL